MMHGDLSCNERDALKNGLLFALFLIPALAWPEKPKANPAEFTIDLHVQSSRMTQQCTDVTQGNSLCIQIQELSVTVAGKKIELRGDTMTRNPYVLHVGDYKAKVLKEDTSLSYGVRRTYQLLFPDGQTAEYLVTGELE
jgi:hypothetical protein